MSKFDTEYYVMETDGTDNHPLLSWGDTDYDPFLEERPVNNSELSFPLEVIFDDPYPQNYEMADLLMLGAQNAASEKLKKLFEKESIYGVQCFPIEVTTNKGNTELGHFAMHLWNHISAVDKDNYKGSEVDEFGFINILDKFSLDSKTLESIPLEKRLIFRLAENSVKMIVHQSVYEAIKAEQLTGMAFFRVDEWDTGSIFRM